MSQKLTIEKINQDIEFYFKELTLEQKKVLRNMLVDTWNAGSKYMVIGKDRIKVK